MLEQSTALPWSKPKFACASMQVPFVWSHVIASHCLRLFQPPRSKTKPTLPDLVCSCIGVSQSQPSTYRIALSKRKNPIRCSVVLALGESNNGRLKTIKSSPVVRQDHTEIYGVSYRFSSPDATQTIWIIHTLS